MPTYDYICPVCSNEFEAIVTRDERDKIICSECNVIAERKISVCSGRINRECNTTSCRSCSGCGK
jgi:putative FmdB family regulatory protein